MSGELVSAQPLGMALHSHETQQLNRAAAVLEMERECSKQVFLKNLFILLNKFYRNTTLV